MRCFVVAGFLLRSASRGPSAIAELLVVMCGQNVGSNNNLFYLPLTLTTASALHSNSRQKSRLFIHMLYYCLALTSG